MLSELYELRLYIQEYIEIAAGAINLDIYMADNNMLRVAETGMFRDTIGMNLPAGCVTEYVLKGKSQVILFDPQENPICKQCPIKEADGCFKEYSINVPILSGNRLYGCFSIAAITENQKSVLKGKQNEFVKLAEFLCGTLVEKLEKSQLQSKLTIVNHLVGEGIIVTDWRGETLSYNNKALSFVREYKNICEMLCTGGISDFPTI